MLRFYQSQCFQPAASLSPIASIITSHGLLKLNMIKGYHFIGLLSNEAACWRILRQNNLISIIIRLHPLSHELPNQASTNSSTSCKVVDVGVNSIQEWIPCTWTISRVLLDFPNSEKTIGFFIIVSESVKWLVVHLSMEAISELSSFPDRLLEIRHKRC